MPKMPSALALPASSSQVKGYQASALGPTYKTSPYPSPVPLAQSFPEHFALVGGSREEAILGNGKCKEGQWGLRPGQW